jgi:LmbE family N-acetylglucosaminyl deacetylase
LIIAPHADDELLSSYTLLKMRTNVTVYYCGFTGTNNSENNKKTRHGEIEALCAELRIPLISGDGSVLSLKNTIIHGGYNVLIIPSIVDWHPQHRLISYNLLDMLKETNLQLYIYSYSVTVPNESHKSVMYVPISKEEHNKKYILFKKIYHSQSFMPLYRFRINERVNGVNCNSYAAEAFLNYNVLEWMKEIERIRPQENDRDSSFMKLAEALKLNLGNMSIVRSISRNIYSILESNNSKK